MSEGHDTEQYVSHCNLAKCSLTPLFFVASLYFSYTNEKCVLWFSNEMCSYLQEITVHCFSVEKSIYINVSKCVVDGSDLKYISHVPCHKSEVHLDEEKNYELGA